SQVITYQLTEGSTILSSPAPAGSNGTVLEEQLSGTFTAVLELFKGAPNCLNTLLCLEVTEYAFQSAHFTVTGKAGLIYESSLRPPDFVHVGFVGSINGQPFPLGGFGPFDS